MKLQEALDLVQDPSPMDERSIVEFFQNKIDSVEFDDGVCLRKILPKDPDKNYVQFQNKAYALVEAVHYEVIKANAIKQEQRKGGLYIRLDDERNREDEMRNKLREVAREKSVYNRPTKKARKDVQFYADSDPMDCNQEPQKVITKIWEELRSLYDAFDSTLEQFGTKTGGTETNHQSTESTMSDNTNHTSYSNLFSRNLIYFGAPGTGKSHELNRKVNDMFPNRYERVTFYPTYSYAQFVGCYKPVMKRKTASEAEKTDVESASNISIEELAQKLKQAYDAAANAEPGQTAAVLLFAEQYIDALNAQGKSVAKSVVEKAGLPVTAYTAWLAAGIRAASFKAKQSAETNEEEVSYKFVPGPFLRLLVKALNDPAQDYCLVIEEINRANAAAVFGDMFQLLDRATQNSNDGNVKKGESEYDIEASEDIKKFLKENGIERNKLRIPANMYIWATMNSADQGVFPMDTAFKRRWEFEYVDIDNGVDAAGNGALSPDQWTIADKKHKYKWNEVRQFVNDLLSENGVNEDKLMGAHFVTVTETDEKGLLSIVSENTFKSKVLMYLWEDAARMSRKRFFADGIGIRTFADLRKQWDDKGVAVFKSGKKDGKDVVPPKDLNETAKEPIDP